MQKVKVKPKEKTIKDWFKFWKDNAKPLPKEKKFYNEK